MIKLPVCGISVFSIAPAVGPSLVERRTWDAGREQVSVRAVQTDKSAQALCRTNSKQSPSHCLDRFDLTTVQQVSSQGHDSAKDGQAWA